MINRIEENDKTFLVEQDRFHASTMFAYKNLHFFVWRLFLWTFFIPRVSEKRASSELLMTQAKHNEN